MDEYVSSTLRSGNTRISKVRRFLAKPPKAAVMLRFVAAAEEGEAQAPLREWELEEVVPELAEDILAMLDDHAVEMGGHVSALLTYVDCDGKTRGTLLLKRQANHVLADSAGSDSLQTPEDINMTLTGDTRAQSQQAQRHNEIMFRVYMAGMASNMAHSERMVARMADMMEVIASRLGSAERRADAREREIEELLDLVRTMRAANDNASEAEPGASAQDRALKFLEMLAPALMQRMMGGNAAPPPPRDAASGE